MEESSLHTTSEKHLFISTQYYDKHGVPPTKRLFKSFGITRRDAVAGITLCDRWKVQTNGLRLPGENLHSRVKEEIVGQMILESMIFCSVVRTVMSTGGTIVIRAKFVSSHRYASFQNGLGMLIVGRLPSYIYGNVMVHCRRPKGSVGRNKVFQAMARLWELQHLYERAFSRDTQIFFTNVAGNLLSPIPILLIRGGECKSLSSTSEGSAIDVSSVLAAQILKFLFLTAGENNLHGWNGMIRAHTI
ncbi:hypothetical protein Tco_1406910 [Tanacetum coccineum]